jgi:glycosyltransferase involved in cell wall biosynthesis
LGIAYHPFEFSWIDRLFGGRGKIARWIMDARPDLVHAWMGRAASFVPPLSNVPALGWFGGYYDLRRYQNCQYYMGVTRDIVRYLGRETKTPERCFLGHTFGTLPPAPPVIRADLNTPEGAPIVLLLSRMHPKKGVDTLLYAAVKLPGVYFWLAGDGPNISEYKALCTRLGLDGRVRFLGWRNDRAALLGAASVCTLPSRYEPFGTVMPESWLAGVPLVASRAAGASQYVTDGVDGLLCDIDDVDGLANALNRAMTDEQLRTRLIAHGYETGARLFSRDAVIVQLMNSYTKMVADFQEKEARAA